NCAAGPCGNSDTTPACHPCSKRPKCRPSSSWSTRTPARVADGYSTSRRSCRVSSVAILLISSAACMSEFQKVFQYFLSFCSRFFRVKLYRVKIILLQGGAVIDDVVAGSHGIGAQRRVIAVHEVHAVVFGHMLKDGA